MKNPLLYIIHIHQSLRKILDYTQDGRDAFMADPKTQDAVVRNFEIIGEATKRLPPELTMAYPQIPWRRNDSYEIIGLWGYRFSSFGMRSFHEHFPDRASCSR